MPSVPSLGSGARLRQPMRPWFSEGSGPHLALFVVAGITSVGDHAPGCGRSAQCSGHLNGTRRELACHVSQERSGPLDSGQVTAGRTVMITLGLWLVATGILALSFECLGAALVFFCIAWLLIG